MPYLNLTPTLSFEPRFRMFIINGYDNKSKRLQSLDVLSNFWSFRLINTTVCKTPVLKKCFNSWKKYFLVWYFIGNQVFINFVLLFVLVYLVLFELMQLVCLVMQW